MNENNNQNINESDTSYLKLFVIIIFIFVMLIAFNRIFSDNVKGRYTAESVESSNLRTTEVVEEAEGETSSIYSRDDFKALILGKTSNQIILLLGRPNQTQETGSRVMLWYYNEITVDQYSERIDDLVQIYFQDNIAVDITFL
jgi:hypothetical protein